MHNTGFELIMSELQTECSLEVKGTFVALVSIEMIWEGYPYCTQNTEAFSSYKKSIPCEP